jgi:TPR repeat protein
MLHAILSILVGALGGLSARVIFSFAASVVLLPLSLFSSRRETQVSTVQAALALCLLVIAVSLYDFAVIKSWKGIVEHLTWGDYIGIVVFCVSSACIPDSRAADMAGDCKYNSMILNAGVYFSLFIPVGFLLMDCSENMWSYLSFIIVFLLFSFFLIDFHCSKKSMKQIFADGNNYPEIEIEKKRWAGRKWRMIAIIISVCFLTAFSVVQLFNGKKYAHENETVELDHTRLMDLGEQYLNKGDVERAVSCFKKSAEFGNAKAQRMLGDCYYVGEGIREDKQEAVKWYRLAAEQGDAEAQRMLGACYYVGEGIREDKREAVKWYRLAAEQGDAAAQRGLGDCYYVGEGIREDKREAVKWFRLAADQGDAEAQRMLGVCYYVGEGIREDKQEAVKWFRLAAEQGDAEAQRMLGDCYYFGTGIREDKREAVKWFRLAAEQGDAEAQRMLGACYYVGEGIREDKREAVKWYRLAAEQGDAAAQWMLGDCYFFGHGVGKNKREAVNWYFLSAKKGNAEAQRRLGACFYFGHGVAKNRQEAIRWYRLAAEQGNSVAISMLKKLGVM